MSGADALLAARLCAVDPAGLGGMWLRGDGEAALGELGSTLKLRRLPANVDDEALLGGLDLGAALSGRGAVMRTGLLAEAKGGAIVVPMAERLDSGIAAQIGSALDRGDVTVVALDAGVDGEAPPASLIERLALHVGEGITDDDTPAAPVDDLAAMTALATAADALGVRSDRALLFALRTARASAQLARRPLDEADLRVALRLVLGPRATRVPSEAPDAPPPPPPEGNASNPGEGQALEDRIVEAARAAIPADLLAQLDGGAGRGTGNRARGSGAKRRSPTRGRPAGVRAGEPRGGKRLALIETLRAAAPWQRVRGRTDRILVRKSDLRVKRFEARAETVTIFAVDASGSQAAARLAEAKGAIEQLLAQAYVQRAEVALIAFRGTVAELILPPTRSLTRARRSLAELPGGGGTPLAAGLDMAREVALATRAKGRTPFIVVLSDGRANVGKDGAGGRTQAARDAEGAAKAIAYDGISAVFVDTATRSSPDAQACARMMAARYIALPYADPAAVGAAVRAAVKT